MNKIIEKELSYKLGGIFFEIQNEIGRFAREKQYADLLEKKLEIAGLKFKKEVPIEIAGRKSNFADFIIKDRVIIDLKAKPFIKKEDYYQMKRYLEVTGLELGIIVNLRDEYLKPRRVLNGKLVDSDVKFVASDRAKGFTVVELLVALAVFSIVISIGSGVFIRSMRTQRVITSFIAANSNASLAMEQMAREIRTGQSFCALAESELQCESLGGTAYASIAFISARDGKVKYELREQENGAVALARMAFDKGEPLLPITADNVNIQNLTFYISEPGQQKRITVTLGVAATGIPSEDAFINLQTTLSPRVLQE